jgi:hypothetical protein
LAVLFGQCGHHRFDERLIRFALNLRVRDKPAQRGQVFTERDNVLQSGQIAVPGNKRVIRKVLRQCLESIDRRLRWRLSAPA